MIFGERRSNGAGRASAPLVEAELSGVCDDAGSVLAYVTEAQVLFESQDAAQRKPMSLPERRRTVSTIAVRILRLLL
jgi:hypothetical protein